LPAPFGPAITMRLGFLMFIFYRCIVIDSCFIATFSDMQ
jgi:hypothetical protein